MNVDISTTQGHREKSRIISIDILRAIAIIGMMATHFGFTKTNTFTLFRPSSWTSLPVGHSAAAFGIVAGISACILYSSAQQKQYSETEIKYIFITRGIALLVIGEILRLIVAIPIEILSTYGLVFISLAWILPMLARNKFILCFILIVLHVSSKYVQAFYYELIPADSSLVWLISSEYPPLLWLIYTLFGLFLYQTVYEKFFAKKVLLCSSIAFALFSALYIFFEKTALVKNEAFDVLLSGAPHSKGIFEILFNVSLVFILCTAISLRMDHRPSTTAHLLPLQNLGKMGASIYVFHLLSIAALMNTWTWSLNTGGKISGSIVATTKTELANACEQKSIPAEISVGKKIALETLLPQSQAPDVGRKTPLVNALVFGCSLLVFFGFTTLWFKNHRKGPIEALLAKISAIPRENRH